MFDAVIKVLKDLAPEAPRIATVLAGPGAGAVVSGLESILHISNSTPEQLTTALTQATPNQKLAIQKLAQDFQISMQQLQNENFQTETQDINAARNREEIEEGINPKANRPMHIFAYAAILQHFMLNAVCWFYPGFPNGLQSSVFWLDVSVVICVLIYYFGDSIKGLFKST